MTLELLYQNVRGLRTKTREFKCSILSSNYDLICITETWLLPGIYNEELFDSRYVVYRTDRPYERLSVGRGGGVLLAARSSLRTRAAPLPDPRSLPDIELTGLVLEYSDIGNCLKSIRIYCCYILQSNKQLTSLSKYLDFIEEQRNLFPDDDFLLVGDFNIAHAIWEPSPDGACKLIFGNLSPPLVTELNRFMNYTNLLQYNTIPNNNSRMLDLILSSVKCTVSRCPMPVVKEDGHHPSLDILIDINVKPSLKCPNKTVKLFHKADYTSVRSWLAETDWPDALACLDPDSACTYFYNKLYDAVDLHVPTKVIKKPHKYPTWFNESLKKIIKEKLKYHKKWKKYKNLNDYRTFSLLRERQKAMQNKCYSEYIAHCEENIKCDPKFFWNFIKNKKSSNGLPNSMVYGDQSAANVQGICDLFNNFFQSVYEKPPPSSIEPDLTHIDSKLDISKVILNEDKVLIYLKNININKGMGPDGIHPLFLVNCASVLYIPITIIFNKSLSQGIFPAIWKRTNIIPIFKTGSRHKVTDYRPISKLCVLGKLFEKIIYDIIYPLIRPTIINNQHGFVSGRSVETNLCELTHTVLKAMEDGHQVDVVYTDYSKAFDKLSHFHLLRKLEAVGIHGDLLRWLESYLSNRCQAVAINGFTSAFVPVHSGVPQGSHLGPLLFNIFINDILYYLHHSDCLLYADDKKIFKIIREPQDCTNLQSDLNNLCVFCSVNHLSLNVSKCNVISFSRKTNTTFTTYYLNGQNIQRVDRVRDLGVILDEKMSFVPHIEHITNKAYSMLGFVLRSCRDFRNPATYKILFFAYVRSVLEFASVIWSPQYHIYINMIEKIQNKFIKYVNFRLCGDEKFKLTSLQTRRMHSDIMFLHKIINNLLDTPFLLSKINFNCPAKLTRSCLTFSIPNAKTNYSQNSFLIRASKLCNKVCKDLDLFMLSSNVLKNRLNNLRTD